MDGSAARVLSFADRTGDISIRRSSVYFDFHVYHLSHIHHNPSYEWTPCLLLIWQIEHFIVYEKHRFYLPLLFMSPKSRRKRP